MKIIILFITLCLALLCFSNSYPADKITQKTQGDQSPAVNVGPGGKSIINYGIPGELVANIIPEIKCKLEYPLKLEKEVVRKQIDNPEITLINTGPTKVVALSVDLDSYLYDVNRAMIETYAVLRFDTHGHFIFVKELLPTDEIKREVNGFHCQGKVAIYVFSLKYYREADMKVFDRQDIFFVENYEILSEKDYLKNGKYSKIIQAVKSYKPPPDNEKTCVQGIDDHAWYLKETPKSGLVLLTDGGKGLTVSGIPEDPRAAIKQSYAKEKRPLLYVTPSRFKETGTYLNPRIVSNDTINISFRYEIENIGDSEAVRVSHVGGAPFAKSLRPGDKIYWNSEVILSNKDGPNQSPQDVISDIDEQYFFLVVDATLLYYQESENKEYMTDFSYKIGQKKVELIRFKAK